MAVVQQLRRALPNFKPLYLCTERSIDRDILEPTGDEFIPQPIVPPPPAGGIHGLLRFWPSWRKTTDLVKQVLRERIPAAVVGLGGYAAGAAVRLAAKRGVPTTILNPDVIPGKANQYLMRFAQAVCCQFDATQQHVAPEYRPKLRTTGCPIRQQFTQLPPREEAASRLMIDPMLHTLVITGASQGARTVNEAVVAMFRDFKLRGWQILHLSGKEHVSYVRAGYRDIGVNARVLDFTPAMADVWSVADLAISRSGASTCAELTACGIPSILMPYPFHKDLHQRANAKVLADAGAAVLLDDQKEAKINAKALAPLLEPLLYDNNKRQAMAQAARQLGHPNAAAAVADVVTQMLSLNR